MKKLKIGLPKGSLQEATIELFARAGFKVVISERSYLPSVDDVELEPLLFHAQEMPRYVAKGALDAGLTGKDWVLESGSKVKVVRELSYARQGPSPVRWVLAVPRGSSVKSVKDLEGKTIATELVRVTKNFLKKKGVAARVEFYWGATEAKAGELADAIVELTETGRSLQAHNLRIVDTVLESVTQFIANKASWQDPWKRQKMETLALLLEGAISAREKVGLKMNVSGQALPKLLAKLPALRRPTVSPLAEEGWFAIETVVDEKVVRELIPTLKKCGAQGIIEYSLNKVIP
jgi:ATP phosphoribosyltransferase